MLGSLLLQPRSHLVAEGVPVNISICARVGIQSHPASTPTSAPTPGTLQLARWQASVIAGGPLLLLCSDVA